MYGHEQQPMRRGDLYGRAFPSQHEFYSTHPNPENRIARINEAIQQKFPDGIPPGLTP